MSDEPPREIWLIRQDDNDYVWCDSPDPSPDIDQKDVYRFLRFDGDSPYGHMCDAD